MTFDAWTRAFVDGGRRHLPDARATRKGPRVVIIRHGERVAQLEMFTVSEKRMCAKMRAAVRRASPNHRDTPGRSRNNALAFR
jgi:hypothetical protein